MKRILFLLFALVVIPNIVFSDAYTELRNNLHQWENNGLSKAAIARRLEVNDGTLRSFLSKKGATSPTVLAKYKAYVKRQKKKRQNKSVPKGPVVAALLASSPDKSEVVIQKKKTEPLPRRMPIEDELQQTGKIVSGLVYCPSKIKKGAKKAAPATPSHVLIPARGYKDDKDAKGVFYDHYVFQRATGHRTKALVADKQVYPFASLSSYLKANSHSLRFGVPDGEKVRPTVGSQFDDSAGLLVIPGRMKDREYDGVRTAHEAGIIREALKRGQPILALCAGSWRLWESYRQLTEDPTYTKIVSDGLVTVKNHVSSRMMSFSDKTGKIVYNLDLHGLKIENDSLLSSAFKGKKWKKPLPEVVKVNSVHWKVVNKQKKPKILRIAATSTHEPKGVTVARLGVIHPEGGAVESFESEAGAPLLGIQWHPEAYNPEDATDSVDHLNILKYMAKAGDAYQLKQRMLKEFKAKIASK